MINVHKVSVIAGGCMNCSEDNEEIYKFNLGNFQCRLCRKCFSDLTKGFECNLIGERIN